MSIVRTLISLMTLVTRDTRDLPKKKKFEKSLSIIREPQCRCRIFATSNKGEKIPRKLSGKNPLTREFFLPNLTEKNRFKES